MNMPPIRHFGGAPSRVLIAGGGVGAIESLLALRALAKERLSIELVAPQREFVYQPLSVLEPFRDIPAPRFDVAEIAVDQGARLHVDTITAVDTERRAVRTAGGRELRYDVLVAAIGAVRSPAMEGALTFGGTKDSRRFADLLLEIERGIVRRVVFAVPPGTVWSLPLYELVLNTAAYLRTRKLESAELTVVTPEDSPLGLFGTEASDVVRNLLTERGVRLRTGSYPAKIADGRVSLVPHGDLAADRVVTLPRLEGPCLKGLPADEGGFIPIDDHCRVEGLGEVYAVGDATSFPIKQGGITAEQADAAAEAIASRAGAPVTPKPFRPVLRGLLLTGDEPRYLSASITRGPAIGSEADAEPLWWPPTKIPGRFLSAYLAERGLAAAITQRRPEATVPFEVRISPAVGVGSNGKG
jgi:sulfide:quinone oxidoreductase